MSTGQSLDGVVHSSLGESGQQTSKAIENFGVSVENLLVKYGKKIIGKRLHLHPFCKRNAQKSRYLQ